MQNNPDIVIGKKYSLNSSLLSEERPYWVYLPASYDDTTYARKHYPVLYLLDGDAHFYSASGVVQFMSAGINGNIQIPELIVVALPHIDRSRELTPTHSITFPYGKEAAFLETSGGGDKFLQFIHEELFMHIELTYRTQPYRILVGHSFGGLLTLHALLNVPEMFQAYIAIDPSLWWDNQLLVRSIEIRNKVNALNGTVYMTLANHSPDGKDDPGGMDNAARAFAKVLETFASSTFRSSLQQFKEEDHGSVPLLSLYHGLLYIFEGYKPPLEFTENPSVTVLNNQFARISERLGIDLRPPEAFVNMVAIDQFEDVDKAIEFFRLNVVNYPNSANVYASLAKAYEIKGDKQQALMQLEKSLELNPDNQTVKDQLQKLQENKGFTDSQEPLG
jgi:uncharacterized protein